MPTRTAPPESPTPHVRNVAFDLDPDRRPRAWYEGRRAASLFFDNLSIFFPEGEAFFVRSVRRYRHLVAEPRLQEQVRAFCAQEGVHTREHVAYNAMLRARGWRAGELDARVGRLLRLVDAVTPPRWRLAATTCLEHFTATMALFMLDQPRRPGVDPVMDALWRWHAAEELEHRSVAFDVYEQAGGNFPERAGIMVLTTAIFWAKVLEQQVALMRDEGIARDPREWLDLARVLLVEPGVLRHVARAWAAWFRPGFHPRDLASAERLARWEREFEQAPVYVESRRAATTRARAAARQQARLREPEVEVAIVGAGFSGLGMAIRLQQAGRRSFTVLEKGHDVGGTWRENTYPGCACDVPSHVYSFSFEPNPRWSRRFAPQAEILEYLRGCADRHGLRPRMRFGTELTAARFDDARALWRLTTSAGELTARHLALGVGALHRPSVPSFPGAERFRGAAFHTARWDAAYDLRGKRVAVIGTGASAIQVVPRIAPLVARLDVYQRTPPWVLPILDHALSPRAQRAFAAVPGLRLLYRALTFAGLESRAVAFAHEPRLMHALAGLGRLHLRLRVSDPALRARLTPDYLPGCKRILISNEYYPALCRDNVTLVTDPIREVTERGLVTADGREREVDAIIYGTGFRVAEPPPRGQVVGRGGLDLADAWAGRVEAYLGTTVPGFPNLFHLMGPNTGLGHNSMVFMIEAQLDHALALLRAADRRGARAVEVRPEAHRRYNDALAPRLARAVWGSGCRSWYLDARGHNPTAWPGSTLEFWWRTRGLVEEDYLFSSPPPLA